MNKTHTLARQTGKLLLILAITASGLTARAQTLATETAPATNTNRDTVELNRYIVSASRTAQDPRYIPSSVTLLSLPDLSQAQITDLRTALTQVPGLAVVNTGGAVGSQTAVFIRGADQTHTLFMIDGVRMNTTSFTTGYNNYLGGAGLGGVDRIEVLRGPQSTLYGSSAIGGVISLETARGNGPANGAIVATAGSFETYGAAINAQGSAGILSYSGALSYFQTQNDRPNNDLKQWSYSTRLEYTVLPQLNIGLTYRGQNADYHEAGSIYNNSTGESLRDTNILTLYGDWTPLANLRSHLTYGWVQNQYQWTDAYGIAPSHGTRNILDWQNTWEPVAWAQIIAGINAEWSTYYSGNTYARDDLQSLFVNAVVRPIKNLELTGGIRGDDYSTVGTHVTGRAGAAYRITQTNTKFRATYGTGFNAPDPVYRIGGPYYAPNPNIKPEESQGWDIGVDQDLLKNRVTLGATYFQNKITNLYEYASLPTPPYGMEINRQSATIKGAEVFATAQLTDYINARASYTYVDARDDATGEALRRRPRHSFDAEITTRPLKAWIIGAGAHCVTGRPDEKAYINYVSTNVAMSGYTTYRIFTSYEIIKGLALKARVENLFDKQYQDIAGYPSLPVGYYGSIEWKF